MGIDVQGNDATQLYTNLMWFIDVNGQEEQSRNGTVGTVRRPVTFCLKNPAFRTLYAPIRRPNHVFHVMEAIWMLAGRNHVGPLLEFNHGIEQFTEDKIMHGAYGHRWFEHFGVDQIELIAARLRHNLEDRQAVLTMWDPEADLMRNNFKDRPCNTHAYFRVAPNGYLNMHVCNRSNDLIWGALGSNIVHFTMLQEVLASMLGLDLGQYYVTTNNLHIYKDYPNLDEVMTEAKYLAHTVRYPTPLILTNESPSQFLHDCETFVSSEWDSRGTECRWFRNVAEPMVTWYRNKGLRKDLLHEVGCEAWQHGLRQFGGLDDYTSEI